MLRDLEEGDLWLERYHVPTWLEYVRHVQRRTHEDASNHGYILSLHGGSEAPRVKRMIERQTGSLPFGRVGAEYEVSLPDPARGV